MQNNILLVNVDNYHQQYNDIPSWYLWMYECVFFSYLNDYNYYSETAMLFKRYNIYV